MDVPSLPPVIPILHAPSDLLGGFCLCVLLQCVHKCFYKLCLLNYTLVLVLVPIAPVCLLGVPCACGSVPPASFSLQLSYCSALASLCTVPLCWCVRSGQYLALHAAFWCSIRPRSSAQQLLRSSFRIPIGVQTPLLLQRSEAWSCHLVPSMLTFFLHFYVLLRRVDP